MKQLIGIAVLLAAGPLAAQEITIDYAKDVDFATVKTFQYSETEDTNIKDPMMGERIVADLKAKLIDGGLSEVQDSPDIYVTYHVTREEKQKVNTQTFGYGGYAAGWGRWTGAGGEPNSMTTETPYTRRGAITGDSCCGYVRGRHESAPGRSTTPRLHSTPGAYLPPSGACSAEAVCGRDWARDALRRVCPARHGAVVPEDGHAGTVRGM